MDFTSFGYAALKDFICQIFSHFKWKYEDRLVEFTYPSKSGIQKRLEEQGYKVYWENADRVESLKLEGYVVHYEEDTKSRIRHRLVNSDNQVFMKKKIEV